MAQAARDGTCKHPDFIMHQNRMEWLAHVLRPGAVIARVIGSRHSHLAAS